MDDVADILIREGAESPNADTLDKIAAELVARHGHLSILKRLLDKWVSPSPIKIVPFSGHIPPKTNRTEQFLLSLDKQAGDIMERLLSEAADAGQLLVTKYLLHKGAAPNGENDTSNSPLRLAASKGHNEVIKVLLNTRANINLCNKVR